MRGKSGYYRGGGKRGKKRGGKGGVRVMEAKNNKASKVSRNGNEGQKRTDEFQRLHLVSQPKLRAWVCARTVMERLCKSTVDSNLPY